MSHIISKDGKVYKNSHAGGAVVLCVKDGKVYKNSHPGGAVSLCVKDGKIYKSSSPAGPTLNINSTIHSAIKDSKNHDLALMVAVYHILIKPIF